MGVVWVLGVHSLLMVIWFVVAHFISVVFYLKCECFE